MNRMADGTVEALSRGPPPPPLPVNLSISTDYFSEPSKLPHTSKLLHVAGTKCGHRSQVRVRVPVTVPTVNKEQ